MLLRIFLLVGVLTLPIWGYAQSVAETEAFASGERHLFSTKGHPKSKGAHFTIGYPKTWAALEGERPNIVQKFVNEGGKGFVSVMIQTKDLNVPDDIAMTNEDIQEFFTSDWTTVVKSSAMTVLDHTSTKIEGSPAGLMEFLMKGERVGAAISVHCFGLYFFQNRILVSVMCSVADDVNGKRIMEENFDSYRKLFFLILNSIVFPDKWTK